MKSNRFSGMANREIIFFLAVLMILLFAFGFCLGATNYSNSLQGVSWTSIISSFVSVLGLLLALLTYSQWLHNKLRDDSYLVAKKYLDTLNQAKELLREISFQYSSLCPAPGVLAQSQKSNTEHIDYMLKLQHKLLLVIADLVQSKIELDVWKVKLSKDFEKVHYSFIKTLEDISGIMTGLNSQLSGYLVHNDESCFNEVVIHKQTFDIKKSSAVDVFDEIVRLGFEKMFNFS